MAPVRSCAPDAAATAAGSEPSPLASEVNIGGRAVEPPPPGPRRAVAAGGGGSSEAAASASDARSRDAWARPGSVASNDSSSERPAYTPPSSGSTSRSTTSGPNRPAMYPATGTSPSRRVAGRPGSWPARSRPVARQQAGSGQVAEVRGHAHVLPGGQPPHRAPAPDPRRRGAGQHQAIGQAGRPDQVRPLRPAGQQRFGAHVHGAAGHLGDLQLPARPVRAFQQNGPYRLITQEVRGGQAGDAGADDRDNGLRSGLLHAFTLRGAGPRPGVSHHRGDPG